MKTYLNSHTSASPDPSAPAQLMHSCLVSCGVATRWGQPSAAAKSTEADPTLFCIKRCKVARGCSVSDLAAQHGRRLPLAVSPGRGPSEKAQGHGETHASQRGLQASASSLVGPRRNTGATFFANENRSTTKKKINSAALKATSVNDDMLLTAVCFSRIWENSQKLHIKKIQILYMGFKMTLRKRNLK